MTARVSSIARGEPRLPLRELGALDRRGEAGPGEDLAAAAELDQLDAVAVEIVVLAELVERGAHLVERGVGIQRRRALRR